VFFGLCIRICCCLSKAHETARTSSTDGRDKKYTQNLKCVNPKRRNCLADGNNNDCIYVPCNIPAVFRRVHKIAKSGYYIRHVRLSAWNNSAPNGRILMKRDI
jgi:hypothetical protein